MFDQRHLSRSLGMGRPDGILVARAAVVAEAREWLGTPFHHQAHLKGIGCDCGGLLRGVCMSLGLIPENFAQLVPSDMMGYARTPDGTTFQAACDHFWTRIGRHEIEAGDIVLLRWGPHPQHTAIVADGPHGQSLIHALGPGKPGKVVETPMRWLTMTRRSGPSYVQAYHLPGVEQ